ncbi:hypothetical protein JOQ06_009060, partial [Pogonophryne albipinna]
MPMSDPPYHVTGVRPHSIPSPEEAKEQAGVFDGAASQATSNTQGVKQVGGLC